MKNGIEIYGTTTGPIFMEPGSLDSYSKSLSAIRRVHRDRCGIDIVDMAFTPPSVQAKYAQTDRFAYPKEGM